MDATRGQIIKNRYRSDNFITERKKKTGMSWLKFVKNLSATRAEVKKEKKKIITAINIKRHGEEIFAAPLLCIYAWYCSASDTRVKMTGISAQRDDCRDEGNVKENQVVSGH